jgi:hypothetical protein
MKEGKVLMPKDELKRLKNVLKQYRNVYKTLYLINPTSAEEFLQKQEAYFKIKEWSETHFKYHPNCEKIFKQNTKIYIPKDKMNTYEKLLFEIYESFFTPDNLNKLLLYLEEKFDKIIKKGQSQGMILQEKEENDLTHKILLEGVPFYMSNLLRQKMKDFENSISEQPALIANPLSIKDKNMINFLSGENIKDLVTGLYCVINRNIYERKDIEPYEMYNQFKYMYDEGLFEEKPNMETRTDFIFNFHINYFKESKFKIVTNLTEAIYSLPYELNMKNPEFQLQINDYIQTSFFRPNYSEIKSTMDSSLDYDTGKKLTFLLVLFPNEISLKDRYIEIFLTEKNKSNDENGKKHLIKLDKPLSGVIFKTRRISYEIKKRNIPFILITFYLHGPKDPKNNF